MERDDQIKLSNSVSAKDFIEIVQLLRTSMYQISQSSMMRCAGDPNVESVEMILENTENTLDDLLEQMRGRIVIDLQK